MIQINPTGEKNLFLIIKTCLKCKEVSNKISEKEILIREIYFGQHVSDKDEKIRYENIFQAKKGENVSINRYNKDLIGIKERCHLNRQEKLYGLGIFKTKLFDEVFEECILKIKNSKFNGNVLKATEGFDKELVDYAKERLKKIITYKFIVKKIIDNCYHAEIIVNKNKNYEKNNPLFSMFIKNCAQKIEIIKSDEITSNELENLNILSSK